MRFLIKHLLESIILSFVAIVAMASEPSPLQDLCVADFSGSLSISVNGFPCLDPKKVEARHFSYAGLNVPANFSIYGTSINRLTVDQIPGLNTFGISTVRVDYLPKGVVPPHIHPRATEILLVLQGRISVGFVTSNPENRLISKILQEGDAFVFPMGHVHFQHNVGPGNATVVAFLSSQNPGVISVANSIFGTNPPINNNLLTKAFQVNGATIQSLRSQF